MEHIRCGACWRYLAALVTSAWLACPTMVSAQTIDFDFFRTGAVQTVFDNRGIFLQDPRTSSGLALFPAKSPNNYGFGSGLWVGGLREGEKVVSTAYDASIGVSEFVPGRVREVAYRQSADQILCSDDADDLARWYPEFSDPATGRPIVLSDRDCVVIYHDANQARDVTTPIGLEVRQRTLQFDRGRLSQVLFVMWDVVNAGGAPLKKAFVGVNADMDIGSNFLDDRCSAIPPAPRAGGAAAAPFERGLGFCWDEDFFEFEFDPNPPGFTGVAVLRGPVGRSGEPLPLTSFTITTNPSFGRPQPDPQTDGEQYDLLAGLGARAPFVDPVPSDQRFVAISGPFTLAAGQVQRVVAAYLWANVSNGRTTLPVDPDRCFPDGLPCFLPAPGDPALEELRKVERAAEALVEARLPVLGR